MPKIKWFKNNVPVNSSDQLKIHYDETSGDIALEITQIPVSDIEAFINYTVEAENEFGRAVGKATLVLQAPVVRETTPKIILEAPYVSPLEPQTVKPGLTLIFSAQYKGLPVPEIIWYRNGKPIVEDEDFSIVTENGVSVITVRNMVRQKAGKYEIFATNEIGESRSSASVTVSTSTDVEDDLKAPHFIKQLYPKIVLVNSVVILEALVSSNPVSSFQWFYNAAPIQITKTTRINSKENKSVLIMEIIALENSGVYTCRAENVLGSVTSTVSLKVVENENQLQEENEYISPRFVEKLKPIQLMDGDSLRLPCRVIGHPIPKIQWTHNKKPINEVKGFELLQDSDGLCVLTIPEVFPEDDGVYACSATNKLGKARTKTNVIVEGILCFLIHDDLCVWYGTTYATPKNIPSPYCYYVRVCFNYRMSSIPI